MLREFQGLKLVPCFQLLIRIHNGGTVREKMAEVLEKRNLQSPECLVRSRSPCEHNFLCLFCQFYSREISVILDFERTEMQLGSKPIFMRAERLKMGR